MNIHTLTYTHYFEKNGLGSMEFLYKGIFIGSLLSDRKFQISVYVGTFFGVVSPKTVLCSPPWVIEVPLLVFLIKWLEQVVDLDQTLIFFMIFFFSQVLAKLFYFSLLPLLISQLAQFSKISSSIRVRLGIKHQESLLPKITHSIAPCDDHQPLSYYCSPRWQRVLPFVG